MSDGPFVERAHLGGYRQGGDSATYYPDLWRWLVTTYGISTVVDVGCGEGWSTEFFACLGCDVTGIEGVPQENPLVVQHDFTLGPYGPVGDRAQTWDLAWACEFVEHVEEQYVPNFLETFRAARMVLMTHAEPGQGGYHHVNCQPDTYWISKLLDVGHVYDEGLTLATRTLARQNLSPWNHYARSGLAFVKLDDLRAR